MRKHKRFNQMETGHVRKRPDPEEIFKQIDRAKEYNDTIDLYSTVEQNEDFYIGDQWRGLQERTPDLLLITLNFLQRVCTMFVSKVVSDDIAANITELHETKGGEDLMRSIGREVDAVIELTDLKKKNRKHVRDAVVDGDAAVYFWFDADAPNGDETATGAIRAETIENINVLFGNPYEPDVQQQPYVIIIKRVPLDEIREEARDNSVPEDRIEQIQPDEDTNQGEQGSSNDLVTVATKLIKDRKTKTVLSVKATEKVIISERDTGLTLYPIAWMPWEPVRKSYHGRAAITGLIPNQIALNTTWTSIMTQTRNTAFGKLIYSGLIEKWNPSPGAAIKVPGQIDISKIAMYLQGAPVNPSITNMLESMLSLTRDCMGTSDATMGDVKADNYSAIVTLQNADNYPIELHRQEFHSFVEAQVRIIIDMMRAYYGTREVSVDSVDEKTGETLKALKDFDFSTLTDANVKIRVDIGASSYWSETMQVETLNNIFTSGIMQNPQLALIFLESMPEKFVPRKAKLVEYCKQMITQAGVQEPTAADV